jgi:hypothetical protein
MCIRGIPEVLESCCYSKNALAAQSCDKNLHKKWFLLAVLIRNCTMHETYASMWKWRVNFILFKTKF